MSPAASIRLINSRGLDPGIYELGTGSDHELSKERRA